MKLREWKFVVFEEVTSAYYTKFLEKSCYYLLIMYMNQHHRKSRERQTKFWKRARAIFNLHLCYNFALLFSDQWECTGFQQIRSVHVIFSCTLLQMFQNQDRCRKGNWCFQINIEIVLYREQLLQKYQGGALDKRIKEQGGFNLNLYIFSYFSNLFMWSVILKNNNKFRIKHLFWQ